MKRGHERSSVEGYFVQVLIVNGEVQSRFSQKSYYKDRVRVLLIFPDGDAQEVFGRICYSDEVEDNKIAYGFSVIDGFYSLPASKIQMRSY